MTITLTREEAQQVLDAMQQAHGDYHMMPGRVGPKEAFALLRSAIQTLRARLAQTEQKQTDEYCLFHYKIQKPQPEPEPTLICPTCKADRFKEDCNGNRMNCGLKFEAYGVKHE